jgi:hypothetical protein
VQGEAADRVIDPSTPGKGAVPDGTAIRDQQPGAPGSGGQPYRGRLINHAGQAKRLVPRYLRDHGSAAVRTGCRCTSGRPATP